MICPICYKNCVSFGFHYKFNNQLICDKCVYDHFSTFNGILTLEDARPFDYDFVPSNFIFQRMPYERTDLYCGVELEINTKAKERRQLINDFITDSFFYFKNDASINVYGLEIVSHPGSLKYHLHNKWDKLFHFFKNNNIENVRNCGLHFHFNRSAFTQDQIASLDYFINSDKSFIENIGGRKLNTFCKLFRKPLSEYGRQTFDRYVALNLKNKNTVEMRFFNSTVDYFTFKERLMSAFALCEFARKYNSLCSDVQTNQQNYLKCFEKIKNKIMN